MFFIMKKITLIVLLFTGFLGLGQITTVPSPPEAGGEITLNFNKAGTGLAAYSGDIYAHIGVTADGSQWQYVIGDWGQNDVQPMLTHISGDDYQLVLSPSLFAYFGVPETSTITQICVVFRSASSPYQQTVDYFVEVGSFQANLTSPAENSSTIISSGSNFTISATNTGGNAAYNLLANGVSINSNASTSGYSFTHNNITSNQNYTLEVTQGENVITKSFSVIVNPGTVNEAMPSAYEDGITYNLVDPTVAILVLDAPNKDFVYVAGSFNNWQPLQAHAMKKDPGTGKFWLELTGLTGGETYTYQYWVIDETPFANSPVLVKTADPYSTLVLSPFDDQYIPASKYPDMPVYPEGQEREVTVLKTGQGGYNWQVTDFEKPKKEDLIIYEILVRDFDANRSYQNLIDRIDYFKNLGVNAIQLMPVMEFEGNESWGYNTVFHLANDKFYGPAEKLKEFIDLCHQNGIAVILDVALNHAFGRNPMVRMWMDDPDGNGWGGPSSESPYFNIEAKHAYNVGNDFNHQQVRTKNYVKRVIKHWIQEYRIDGFRWDLTKGFTQNCTASDEGCTNAYQQDRVDVLKEYVDYSWSLDPTHYAIFEHLGTDNEEQQWANYKVDEGKGVMMWGKMTDPYNQLTMGYADNSNINRVGHNAHGFTAKRVVGYAESHDEERLMYKNLQYGNSDNASHNVKDLDVALNRMKALGAVLLPVPGPKMIWHFGELGWDLSIFTCNNGTVNPPGGTDGDCKLDTKPQPQWEDNWMADVQRMAIYNTWSRLIDLKKNEDVFEGEYQITPASGTSLIPKIYIWNDALAATDLKNVVIISNFDVTAQNIDPQFPYTGTWYNLMDNSPITVTNVNELINLPPGEFRMYGNKSVALGTADFTAEKAVLYPNPAKTQFTLNVGAETIELYNITGQLVKTFSNTQPYQILDINGLAQGLYLVKVTDVNKSQSILKMIKN